MTDTIATLDELEACVGTPALGTRMKVIDRLDAGAVRWIAVAPVAFVGVVGAGGPAVTVAGGAPGFALVGGESRLTFKRADMDEAIGAVGQGSSALFLVPGTTESLRVNGRVVAADDETLTIAADECFLHCGKALIRSGFWAAPVDDGPGEADAFVNASRFLALVTADAEGHADVSPKGDPAGSLVRLEEGVATLAERPGNKLAFGYRNMIASPAVAAVAVVPGSTRVAIVTGKARLTTDEAVRNAFVVEGRAPILATMIGEAAPVIRESAALKRAALWPAKSEVAAIDPAAVLVGHVKLNKERGLAAMAIREGISQSTVAKGLDAAYQHTLY